jgi:hypothetical protein
MSSKKKNEFREKDYSRNSEGLKQRRLKEENRWKYNPNETYFDEYDDEGYFDEDSVNYRNK